MSSARKRAALHKANTEAERLKQKLAVAETMGNVWKTAAEYAASKHDVLVALCRQLHKAEETKNQQDWTAVIRALEKIGADSTAAMGSNVEFSGAAPLHGAASAGTQG